MGKEADSKKDAAPVGTSAGRFLRYVVVLLLAGATAMAWLSVTTFSPDDAPAGRMYPPAPAHNMAGFVGAHIAYYMLYWLGDGSYMLLLFLSAVLLLALVGAKVGDLPWRLTGLSLMVTATSAACFVLKPDSTNGFLEGNGGILGISVGQFLLGRFAVGGTWLVLLVTFAVAVMLTADNLVLRLPVWGKKIWRGGAAPALRAVAAAMPQGKAALETAPAMRAPQGGPARGKAEPAKNDSPRAEATRPDRPALLNDHEVPPGASAATSATRPPKEAKPAPARPALPLPEPGADRPEDSQADEPIESPYRTLPAAVKPSTLFPMPAKPAKPMPAKPVRRGKYQLPGMDLLSEPTGNVQASREASAAEKRIVLQQTLDNFNVEARVLGFRTGPVITLYECSLAPGVKVSQINALAPDIARSLAVPGVRVVSPLPGRDTVGIEVPNLEKEIVRLKELMGLASESVEKMQLPLFLGKDAEGNLLVADLAAMPHMLMAGTTGSGKSVCINAIITSLLLTRTPDDVRFIMADPKMVEMASYEKIPHLLCPIINDMRKAEDILEWAATKMDERYELLKEAGVRNIVGFNTLAPEELYKRFDATTEEDKAQIPTRLPYYVIIIDELADLIMTSSKEVEAHIIRIAQKARAVGIHLILATQRPSVNVVTGLIKSNMPCRISFRVASRQESRIILDQNGADVLLGQGDMLFLQPGTSNLSRAQGTYVDEKEIRAIVECVRNMAEPEYCQELMKLQSGADPEAAEGERDSMFDQAVEIVLASQRGSVSLLQRRLQVGYSRASRIVDQMAEAGILGDYKGSQARECLLTLEDWQSMKANIHADQSGASSADGEPTSV